MQQNLVTAISDDDFCLIEVHQLGEPLAIYRQRQGAIRLLRSLGLLAFLISVLAFTIAIVGPVFVDSGEDIFLIFVLIGLSCILMAFIILSLAVPQEQSDRIIVCEQGLLHIKKKIRAEHVIRMYWNNIVIIRKEAIGLDYYVKDREGQLLTLSIAYQNLDELLALIRQKSEEAGYERQQ